MNRTDTEPSRATDSIPRFGALNARAIEALAEGEPDSFKKRRIAAWTHAERTEFPSRAQELWRRTDISALAWEDLIPACEPHPPIASIDSLPPAIRAELGPVDERSALLVHVDSNVVRVERTPDLESKGVTLLPISEAARERGALVDRYLGSTVRFDESRFTAIQAALQSGGAFLHVPPGVRIDRPIRILVTRTSPDVATFPHVVLAVETGGEVTVIEEYFSEGEPGVGVNVGVTEIVVGEEANVHLATLQRWGPNVYHFGVERVRVGRGGRFHWTFAGLGGKLSKMDMELHLEGEGSEAKFSGCYFGAQNQHFDFHTFQNHAVGHSTSDLLFKGALRDRARAVYQGLIKVHKDAQRSDAYQANRNLLLSSRARADSIPSLEIEANDVRCTHGATVGQVDEEQLFYLMARGLDKNDAEKLIIEGFFEPVLARIPAESLRALLTQAIDRKAGY